MKFTSKYPIVIMPMNGVSTVDLAIVVHKAGAVPSLSIFNYFRNGKLNLQIFESELQRYTDTTGQSGIIVSMHWEHLLSEIVVQLLLKYKINHVELFVRPADTAQWQSLGKQIDILSKQNITVMFKTTGRLPQCVYHGIVLKGPLAAGRSFDGVLPLENQFDLLKSNITAPIIPSGGIGSPHQVKYFIDRGALAIGIGTLIAASQESCVSLQTKQRIVNTTSLDIVQIGPLKSRGLLFSRLENDDDNNSRSLYAGISGTDSGCIYVGNGIDYIKEIRPVKDIIEWLVQDVN